MITRRFLVAPALARLVRHDRGSTLGVEGYFEQRSGRNVFLRVIGREASLVQSTPRDHEDPEEAATGIPLEHAVVLMGSCPGTISFDQANLLLADGQEVLVRHFKGRDALAIVSVSFPSSDMAGRFMTPAWFGSEVTADDAYANQGLALKGIPRFGEVSIADTALNAFMDLLEHRPKPTREQPSAEAESTSPASSELSQEAASALTQGMEHAITGTAEHKAGEDAGSADGQAGRQPAGATVSQLRRPESSLGGLRDGFYMRRPGLARDNKAQDAAMGS
ncbi:MAG: hypothetical protein M3145_09310 [Pseudomonadota bacterium]|nr:hypothetical protein [Pseudomonadota bacterium]